MPVAGATSIAAQSISERGAAVSPIRTAPGRRPTASTENLLTELVSHWRYIQGVVDPEDLGHALSAPALAMGLSELRAGLGGSTETGAAGSATSEPQEASQKRSFSADWPSGEEQYIENAMTEAEIEAKLKVVQSELKLEFGRETSAIQQEVVRVGAEIASLRGSIGAEIATLSGGMGAEIASMRGSLGTEIAALRGSFGTEIAALRGSFGTDIAAMRGGVGAEVAALRGELTGIVANTAGLRATIVTTVIGTAIGATALIFALIAFGGDEFGRGAELRTVVQSEVALQLDSTLNRLDQALSRLDGVSGQADTAPTDRSRQ